MFIIQNCGVTTEERLDVSGVYHVMVGILNYWRSDSEARKDIIKTNEIPALYKDMDVPGQLSGISYKLEPNEFQVLFSMFKREERFRRVSIEVGTPAHVADEYTEELHKVYRILRSKVNPQRN